MSSASLRIPTESILNTPARPVARPDGTLVRLGRAILRRLRRAAWAALDLETEFETLD